MEDAERTKAAHAEHWGPLVRAERYTYMVRWSTEDGEHVGTCVEFPSLSWLGTRPEKALTGIMALVADTIRDLTASGEPVPAPIGVDPDGGLTAFAYTPDDEMERGVEEFKRLWPDKWEAWLRWCRTEDTRADPERHDREGD